jgi:EAL domain-containing protein (putative c-di-GMP-specific phosphodiesterase class I)
LEFCKDTQPAKVFIRLSNQSIGDESLPAWLNTELENHQVSAQQIVLQVPEQEARKRINEAKVLTQGLRQIGVGFAIEHFGVETTQFQILDALKPDYIKIDGQMMYSLTSDVSLQSKVGQVVSAAAEREILTVAERVENANTMAVLFQLGVSYMQGHYVHEPDVVLDEAG